MPTHQGRALAKFSLGKYVFTRGLAVMDMQIAATYDTSGDASVRGSGALAKLRAFLRRHRRCRAQFDWKSASGFKVISQQPAGETLNKGFPPAPAEIRAQLRQLLAHPLFTNSKRYPVFLAYTVEQTLLGNSSDLKERTIGVEAFGRKPDYDANADPVVRTTAAEVRKRLIQYYYDPSHAGELIIELSAGSYVPAFRQSNPQRMDEAGNDSAALKRDVADAEIETTQGNVPSLVLFPAPPRTEYLPSHTSPRSGRWIVVAASLLLGAALGFAIGRYRPFQTPSNMDLFWEPITSSSNPTTYCLGEPDYHAPHPASATTPTEDQIQTRLRLSGRLNMSDVVTLTHTIAPLAARHGAYRVLPAAETSFAQLREGPIVLIGAFDNPWTLRITHGLRYGFEGKDGWWGIVDHRNAQQNPWTIQMSLPSQNLATDYAIVARIHDETTGQPVIIVAGISDQGTEAASEVVYNPVYLQSLLDKAPGTGTV